MAKNEGFKPESTGSMKSLAGEVDRLKTDKRLTERMLARKQMTRDDVKKHLASLPDLAENAAPMMLDEHLN